MEVGPYNEWMKLERMRALVKARLDMIEEKQSSCVTKLSALSNVFSPTGETLPAKVSPKGHESVLKFPAAKTTAKSVAVKERRVGLFAGLSSRGS